MLHTAALTLLLATAAEPPLTLDWQAPAGCPDAAGVRAMTLDLLRQQQQGEAPPPLDVRVVVTRAGDRWQASLALRSPLGRLDRTLSANQCPLLARATALIVAVHLDPTAVSRTLGPLLDPPVPPVLPAEPSPIDLSSGTAATATAADPTAGSAATTVPAPDLSSEPAPSIAPPEPVAPARPASAPDPLPADLSPKPAPRDTRLRGHLRLAGGLDAGLLPGLGGDLELVGGLGGRRWRVEGGLLGVTPRTRPAVDGAPGGRFARLVGVVRACAVWRIPPQREQVALLGCLGGEVGGLHAVGTDVAVQNPRWTPWGAALLGGAARIPVVGPLGLWVGVEAVIALRRPEFTAGADPDTVFTVTPAGVRANFGLDLQFVARKRRPRTTDFTAPPGLKD